MNLVTCDTIVHFGDELGSIRATTENSIDGLVGRQACPVHCKSSTK